MQPWSTLQKVYTDHMESVAAAWSGLCSVMERLAWDAYARNRIWHNRLGQRVIPIGYQVFLKMNCQALALGGTIQGRTAVVNTFDAAISLGGDSVARSRASDN